MVIWSLAILVVLIVVLNLMFRKGSAKSQMSTRFITEVGITAALAIGLWLIKVFEMPNGGSISLEALPILFLAYKRGYKEGVFAGLVAGIIQLLVTGFKYHPVQLVLDYPLALMCLGLAGLFTSKVKNTKTIIMGTFTGFVLKLLCHTVSGVVFFAEYAPAGMNVWLYSSGYNVTFIGPEFLVCSILFVYLASKGILKK